VLIGLAGGLLALLGLGAYAGAIEPRMIGLTRYAPQLPKWPADLSLRIAVLSDFHACEPWLGASRVRAICERANALRADIILLLGDYRSGPRFSRELEPRQWAAELARLSAPLGVHAILGNHDYWADEASRVSRDEPTLAELALRAVGIPVYINQAVRIEKSGRGFWLAGLGDQLAFVEGDKGIRHAGFGVDDISATLALTDVNEPVLLMAHEPDIFPNVPDWVALTLSGHTHGGQFRAFGYSPFVPSRFGSRYIYGHIVEDGRHLIVNSGLGMSSLPFRFGAPPEMLLIELGGSAPKGLFKP
jgi:uncharacterized protein